MFLPPQEGAISSEYLAKSAYLNDKKINTFAHGRKVKQVPSLETYAGSIPSHASKVVFCKI